MEEYSMEEGLKAFPPRARHDKDDEFEFACEFFESTIPTKPAAKDRSKRQNRRKTDFQKRKALLEKLTYGHSEQIYSCGNHVHSRKWIGCEMQKHETTKRVRARLKDEEELPHGSKWYKTIITVGRKRPDVEFFPEEFGINPDFEEKPVAEALDADRHAVPERELTDGKLYETDEGIYILKMPAENGKTRIVVLEDIFSMTV